MILTELRVANLRSHELFTAEIHPGTTLILGANGAGKTSLLEAIYTLYRGTSFRGRDKDIIAHGQQQAEMKTVFNDGAHRKLTLSVNDLAKIERRFTIDSSPSQRLPLKHRLAVVLFEPDELRLLSSSPQRRRDFIDGIIARLSPTYSTVLSRFTRTLAQRNELLKQYEHMSHDVWESHLFAWDVKLAELSATIIKTRRNFIAHSNQHLSRIYSSLAGSDHAVTARYESPFTQTDDSLQQAVLHRLESQRQSDALQGFTTVGPHRDDITLLLNHYVAAESASRGEMRTIMLAFKLLEVELQEHHSQQKPLVLLDDVFSELDSQREQALIAALAEYQTIITATDLRDSLKTDAAVITLV